jgi:hypothetical protein
MTVLEICKLYRLADMEKDYENQYGNSCNLIPIMELKDMTVKSISINFPTNSATITVIDRRDYK